MTKKNTLIIYTADNQDIDLVFDENTQQVWATAQNIADIFKVDVSTIRKHIQNIYQDEEADENSTSAKIALVQIEGSRRVSRDVLHYNIDIILSVGYRVNSRKAALFRQWATQIFKQYLEQGFVIDRKRLNESPELLNKLAAEIRELRLSEKSIYQSIRDCFKLAASDYENNEETRRFYIFLQEKIYYAVTGMTASQLKMDRINHTDKNVGLVHMKGDFPVKKDLESAKNLLSKKELHRMHLLSETFLIFAELAADREIKMTMSMLKDKIDELLRFNEYQIFSGYSDYLKKDAEEHIEREYKQFIEIQKLKYLGVDVDLDLFYDGEYEDYKEQTSQITLHQLKKALLIEE
ncbi:MAG: RhuM family protein [Wohlfahrtiimonas sp.]